MKKGLVKASLIGFFSLFLFGIIFFSLFLSANPTKEYSVKDYKFFNFDENKTYPLNTTLKFDFGGYKNFKLMVITPSGERIFVSPSGDKFLFSFEEEGNYSLSFDRGNGKKFRAYILISSNSEDPPEPEEPPVADELVQEKAEINQPVSWSKSINQSDTTNLIEIPQIINLTLKNEAGESINYTIINVEGKDYIQLDDNISETIKLEYITEPPKLEETILSETIKEVVVSSPAGLSYKEVLSYTQLPREISDKSLIKIYWKEENIYLDFIANDTDNNGLLDYVEWIVPHLSNQTFNIIIITKAEHLFSNRTFVSDIYSQVKNLDDLWSETINEGEYVRVTFEIPLDNTRDITVYPRIISGNPIMEVYEKDENELIAKFENITSNEYNKVYLTNLTGEQDTFDLKVVGGFIEFDHIIDPQTIYNMNPTHRAYWGRPTSSNRWLAGTNATIGQYNNMNSENGVYAVNAMTAGTSNDEPFWRFNFTVDEDISLIGSVFIKFTGWDNATEVGTLYIYNVNSTWMTIGTTPATNGNITKNITSAIGSYINNTNNQLMLVLEGANYDAGDSLMVDHVQITVTYLDRISPYFTYIPLNSSLFYGNESLGVDFNAMDETGFGYFSINDTRFSINSTGFLSNATPLAIGNYEINVSINDTSNNINWTRYKVQVNKSHENCQVLFNETFPTSYTNSFLVWANCTSSFILLRNGTLISNNSEQKLNAGFYNFSVLRDDFSNYSIYYNETSIELNDPIFPLVDFGSATPNNNSKFARTWFLVEALVVEDNEKNITFDLYNSTYNLINSSTYTDSRREINWTSLSEGIYYYNLTVFDTYNNKNSSLTRKITLNLTLPNINFVYPTEDNGIAIQRDWIYANISSSGINEEINITFRLYNSSGLVNESSFTDSRREINWTSLPEEQYFYNVTLFDNPDGRVSTLTRSIILDKTSPDISIISPEDNSSISFYSQNFIADITDNLGLSNFTLFIYNETHLINQTQQSLSGTSDSTEIAYTFDYEGIFKWAYEIFDLAGNIFSTSNLTLFYDTTFPNIEFVYPTEEDDSTFSRDWVYVNISVIENYEKNITFSIYDSSGLVNESSFTDSRREINWTGLNGGDYYYNVTIYDLGNNLNSTETRHINLDFTTYSLNITNPLTSIPRNVSELENISIYFNFTGNDIEITSGVNVNSVLIGEISANILNVTENISIRSNNNGTASNQTLYFSSLPNTQYSVLFNSLTDTDTVYSAGEFPNNLSKITNSFFIQMEDDGGAGEAANFMWAAIPFGTYTINNTAVIQCGNTSGNDLTLGTGEESKRVYMQNAMPNSNYAITCSVSRDEDTPRCGLDSQIQTKNSTTFGLQINDDGGAGENVSNVDYCAFSFGEYSTSNMNFKAGSITIGASGATNVTFANSFPDTAYVVFMVHNEDDSGDMCACETTVIATNSFTSLCQDDGGSATSCIGDTMEWVAFTRGTFDETYVNENKQISYLSGQGWQVNVTTPIGFEGLQDLFINATYNTQTKQDIEIDSIRYKDKTPPYFTLVPQNSSFFYGNESLSVDFDATDETAFGYYRINDTRFSITQAGLLTNSTQMAAGNYEINVSINDTSNNINWTRYKVQINKSNYYDCGVYFNSTSPITYPETFIVYTNCSTDYTLYINGTTISNGSIINSGAGYYNLTVRRTDTSNYTNWFSSEFFTVQRSQEKFNVLFNASSPLTYPDIFLVWTNATTPFTLRRNGTIISNDSIQNNGAGYFNFSAQRTDTSNYSFNYNQSFFTVNKNPENCQVLYNETSPLDYPKTFLVWANCTTTFTLYRNETLISNNSEQALTIGAYNFSMFRTDTQNFSIRFNQSQLRIIDSTPPYFTLVPQNSSFFYGNESLSVDFDATDEIAFGYYRINDTRFSITQTGLLTNSTPMAAGNYEINVSINDSFNNINWTRYKVQINKSNYYDCGVYFNSTSPITYPETFIVYTNCSSAYTLYRNGTAISNNSVINSGAGYFNLTVRRTDTSNYTNWFSSEFFTVQRSQEKFNVLFNASSPLTYPDIFLVWTNATTPFTLRRNGTIISNDSIQNNGAGYFNFSAQRTDTSNYSFNYNQSFFTVNKNPENCQVLYNETSPLDYPKTFLVWANCTTSFTLRRNGTIISNNTEQILAAGSYNFSFLRTDVQNYSLVYNQSWFVINADTTPPYFTLIPQNASFFYGNESLSVDFDATDEIAFGYYKINDTRFSITQAGLLTNSTPMAAGNYEINVTINDSFNNINWTRYKVQINKSNYYDCGIYFNTSSPIIYQENFEVYTNCSSAYTLYRNGTGISNGSTINAGAGYYNLTVRRTDTSNYTNWFSSEFFTVNKNQEEFNVLFNASSPIYYPDTFLVYANSTTPFTLRRNGTVISNNSEQRNGAGYFNFSAQRTDTTNYSYIYNQSFFTLDKNLENCQVLFNETSPISYPGTFLVWANCTTSFTLRRNGTIISNNTEQILAAGSYNFSFLRTDVQNYSLVYNQSWFVINADTTPPYFTLIPQNASFFYGNESLSVDFDATDEIAFGYYKINDTRFSITQAGLLTNSTPMAAGNYEINVTINDSFNNINWTRYKVQINKSNYYDCGIYFNTSSPIIYPENFEVYTNCSSAYTLYRNGTSISNGSIINAGAGYYNLTVRRTDTSNYTNWFNSEFFTVESSQEKFNVLFNATSPITFPDIFLAWTNSTTPFTLRRNGTIVSNNSVQENGAGYFNYSAQRTDTSNYSFNYNQSFFTVNKNTENCQVLYNTSSPITYPETFLVWTNCTTPFTLRRNATIISNNSVINSGASAYNISFSRTDAQNYSIVFNQSQFIVNKASDSCSVYFNATSPITYPDLFMTYTNCTSNYILYRNGTSISNASEINSGAGYYNLTVRRTDTINYTNTANSQFFTINKNTENCRILFNETSPLEYSKTFLAWTNCTTPFTLTRNGTMITNNTEQVLAISAYNFSMLRNDSFNYTFFYNETQFRIVDTTNPNATLISPENNTLTSDPSQNLTVNVTDNVELSNMTLSIYNQTSLINQTTQSISGTQILAGIVYTFAYDGIFNWFYRIFDLAGNSFETQNNTITIDTTSPAISLIYPPNGKVVSNSNVWFESNFSDVNNLVNTTFYLWNSTNDIINVTTINITGSSNSTNISIVLPGYDSYKWNYLTCDNLSNCLMNPENYSLTYEIQEVGISRIYPLIDIEVGQNRFFNISLNVSCLAGECGAINVSLDPISWWDGSWNYRKQINITNNNASRVLESGYSFNFTLDTTGTKFLDNGNDVRIVFYNGTNNIELDRINTSAFNSSSTIIWFKLQKNISASGLDSNYSVYYGNPSALNPPTNKSNIYLFYDNFTNSNAWSTFSGACSASSSQGNPIPSLFMSGSGTTDRCYATNFNLPSSDFVIEADVYISSTGGRGIRNIGFKHTPSHASGYMYRMQTSGGDGGFFTLSGTGTWSKLGSNDPDYSADTWHTLKLLIRGSNFTAWVDNVYRNSVVSSTYSNTKIGTQDDGGADTDSYVDNYIVKGYIYPDPSSSLGDEETGIKTGLVSTITGAIPFYTNVSNPYTSLYLTKGQSQIVNFYVNATGTGRHVFFAFANLTDNTSINNITSYWNVTIDTIPPKLTIISPLNQSYYVSSMDFNISGDEYLDSCKFTLNNWQINYTMSRLNVTSFYYKNNSMFDNIYTAKFSCMDLAGNINNSVNIDFIVDAYGPNISLINPPNNTYRNNFLQNLSFSAQDIIGLKNATLYIFNSSGNLINFTNVYLSGKTILTGVIYTFAYDGIFTWFYSIFDLANHQQNTQNNTITIDTTNPLINYGLETVNNFANVSQNWIYVDTTVNEDNFANLTFYLYNGSTGYLLFNQTTYTDSRRSINWTNLEEGLYWYNATIFDLASNRNITLTRQIRLDTSAPEIRTVFPDNLTYGYDLTLLRYTLDDPLIDSCWYSINDTSNISINCGQNISTLLSNGIYTWRMYANDTLGHLGVSSVSFKVDTNIPAVIIHFPENTTYSYNVSTLNFTAADASLDKCWYILNGGENISANCFSNITNLVSQEGLNELHLYANDSDGNTGFDFVFFSIDTISPVLEIINPKNQSYYPENIFFNISGSENLDFCKFTLDDWTTNYTMNRYNSTYFNYVFNLIEIGNYTAKFWCNDTIGNINDTSFISFSTSYPKIHLDLIYPSSAIEVPRLSSFNFTVNVSCEDVDCGTINVTLDPLENWWNESWNYKKSINLSGTGTLLTDYQINISMNLTEYYLLGKVKSDCSDIRFTNSSSSEISYWTESCYINGSNSIFWVKVPNIAASGNTTIYMYYGNSNALNVSNGTTTFDYFDSGNDVGTWTVVNTAGQTSAQGLPQPSYYAISTNGHYMYKNINLTTNRILEYNSRSDGLGNFFFLTNSAGNGQHMRLETRTSNSAGIGSATGWTTWAAPSQTCSNLATNTWFNFRLVIGSTTAQSYINDVSCGGAYSFSNSGGYIGLVGDALGGTYTTWWDNLRVRKYSSTVPNYFLGNEENKAKGIISTNIGDIPFFADENPITTISLKKGESQVITFIVNATGNSRTYEFFAFANLVKNSNVTNSSSRVNVTILSSVVSLIYPQDGDNFSSLIVPFFNFSINEGEFSNCQLFGNWGSWGVKQTINNPSTNVTLNFSSENIGNDGNYVWNVKCTDNYGNPITSSTNFTFSVFLFPDSPDSLLINISQTKNDGTGNVVLSWNTTNHSDYYKIYYTDNLSIAFNFLGQTNNTNYIDTSANTTRRRFYKISNWNPTGENFSNITLGKTIYYLKRKPDVNNRNWMGFYLENKTLTNANSSFKQINNITAFTMFNSTIQGRVTCNNFSCPDFPSCTDTNCNFDLNDGAGYEVNLNSSSSVFTNWSLVGILKSEAIVQLEKNSTSFGKNWISLYGNSSLINAAGLISSVSFSDAVSGWYELNQTSQGYTPYAFFPMPIGDNFILEPEKGYEISVTQNSIYTQS